MARPLREDVLKTPPGPAMDAMILGELFPDPGSRPDGPSTDCFASWEVVKRMGPGFQGRALKGHNLGTPGGRRAAALAICRAALAETLPA